MTPTTLGTVANTSGATGRPAVSWTDCRAHLPSLALWLVVVGALCSLPFVRVAPNRLVSGEPVYFFWMLQGPGGPLAWGLAVLLLALLLAPLLAMICTSGARLCLWWVAAGAALLLPCLLALAAAYAQTVVQTASPIARTSLGIGFWAAALPGGLMAADAVRRLHTHYAAGALLVAVAVALVATLLGSGAGDELSLMKEYANRSDVFASAIARHVQIVALAILLTLCVGLPMGWAVRRRVRLGRALFPALNIIQTIPSIALFGLLMAPLALLAALLPALGRAGISGVGLAPAVMALMLYSLLPVVRATLAGLDAVPSGVIEAAKGIGMPAWLVFWRVDVPLALPVVLGGVRTAVVQAIGLAAVTALIGAGGLGAIMFEGLFASAQDLVLLGVLPIIALGVLADAVFAGLMVLAAPVGSRQVLPMAAGREHD
ncbi:MAG: binding-protein-dependent transport system inner rane component [Polaromonas sp.]|nr:binding-protein-dependent transport system inner rane component [Polaromonas sp.]